MIRLAVVAMLMFGAPAAAHLTPNSEIGLDIGRGVVVAHLVVPVGELAYATGGARLPAGVTAGAARDELVKYILAHLAVHALDRRAWTLDVGKIEIVAHGSSPDLVAAVTMTPPRGASPRVFDLHYSGVIDRVPNHFVLVVTRSDFDAGHLSATPRMIGGLRHGTETIRVDRGPGSAWRGFASAVGLGMHHIAEGHDHLLFLITLLLPAPLIVAAGRWQGYAGIGPTARHLVAVVTAFSIGHSLTLIGGAVFRMNLPVQPVEVLIAVSILVSAVHAWRPLFAGREAFVAGGFGLVHGLAFATLIGHFGLEPWQQAQSILGFNIGIELVQLAVVAAVMPGLVVLAQTRSYARFRLAAATFAGLAALAWIVERVSGASNRVVQATDALLANAPWLVVALTLAAAALWIRERRV